MFFEQGNAECFLIIFNESKEKIRLFDGCEDLKLVQNKDNPNHFSTISIWQSAQHLENYRQSELFKTTWEKTKKLFSAKPRAVSYDLVFGL
jgi:quinol monooxygenase YgiN